MLQRLQTILYGCIFVFLLFAVGLSYLRAAIWCWSILSPELWYWWLGISYTSVALVMFVLAKKTKLGGIAFDCVQGILLSSIWLPMILLSPLLLLLALGDWLTGLTEGKWTGSKVGQILNKWWSSVG